MITNWSATQQDTKKDSNKRTSGKISYNCKHIRATQIRLIFVTINTQVNIWRRLFLKRIFDMNYFIFAET